MTRNRVYTVGAFGQVVALDRKSREPVWSIDLSTSFDAVRPFFGWCQSPIVCDCLVILAPLGKNVRLAALDQDTGATVWTTPF